DRPAQGLFPGAGPEAPGGRNLQLGARAAARPQPGARPVQPAGAGPAAQRSAWATDAATWLQALATGGRQSLAKRTGAVDEAGGFVDSATVTTTRNAHAEITSLWTAIVARADTDLPAPAGTTRRGRPGRAGRSRHPALRLGSHPGGPYLFRPR